MKFIITLFLFLGFSYCLLSQSVGINTDSSTPDPSALLDVKSTTQGILIPRMNSDQMNNIVNPVKGLLIYSTKTLSFHYYNGTEWIRIAGGTPKSLIDSDNDTGVHVEKFEDEDKIRFHVGTQSMLVLRDNDGAEQQLMIEPKGTYRSTFLGFEAGLDNEVTPYPSGYDNTFIGYRAGKESNLANRNTFIGSFTGEENNEGSDNTFVGVEAGQIIYDGNENTFIGKGSGSNIEDASYNTYVGFESGLSAGGTGNVLLGYKAGRNLSGSNKLVIHNSDTDYPLIYGEFNNRIFRTNGMHSVSDDFIVGREVLPENGVDVYDTLQFFDVSKGAFRAGALDGSKSWSTDSLGFGSFAFGNSNRAKGNLSASWGISNRATGTQSTAWGILNKATAYNATVWGSNSEANANNATVWGQSCDANGVLSTVWGENNVAPSAHETVFGRYATIYTAVNEDGWDSQDRLFAIGNGTNLINRNNALAIYKNGDTKLNGELTITSTDTMNRLNLYAPATDFNDNSSIFFGEDHDGTYGMELRYDGLANELRIFGKNNSTFYGSHLSINRNTGLIKFGDDKFIFNPNIGGNSRFTTDELEIRGGSDLAENFDITEESIVPKPGMLVSIDVENEGKLIITNNPYCPLLAGVISGAEGIKPGMRMGQKGTLADGEYPITLSGRVYVKVNDRGGEIKVGDIITSSTIAGEGMKADKERIRYGTCIGKALGTPNEKGYVLVLINLN